ncbi:MAG: hypothetical protein D6813_16105, partial [Calditrichaeota bacterium]
FFKLKKQYRFTINFGNSKQSEVFFIQRVNLFTIPKQDINTPPNTIIYSKSGQENPKSQSTNPNFILAFGIC